MSKLNNISNKSNPELVIETGAYAVSAIIGIFGITAGIYFINNLIETMTLSNKILSGTALLASVGLTAISVKKVIQTGKELLDRL